MPKSLCLRSRGRKKQNDPDRADRWDLGVKATRAWRVAPDARPHIEVFADTTYAPTRAQVIGSQGMRLAPQEARRLLALELQEVQVFGEPPIIAAAVGPGSQVFEPSKAGPVSQSPYVVREAEGPKSLYILELEGDVCAFLGRDVAEGSIIVKVGMSRSPATRCNDHNSAWPACAFSWTILNCNRADNRTMFPTSKQAICGENAIKKVLAKRGASLSGEFFIASRDVVADAWQEGLDAADNALLDAASNPISR